MTYDKLTPLDVSHLLMNIISRDSDSLIRAALSVRFADRFDVDIPIAFSSKLEHISAKDAKLVAHVTIDISLIHHVDEIVKFLLAIGEGGEEDDYFLDLPFDEVVVGIARYKTFLRLDKPTDN